MHARPLPPQVSSALRHMHERRMMHRDLKPSNIFITAGGDLKLGDLGLSRYFSSRTLQVRRQGRAQGGWRPWVLGLPRDGGRSGGRAQDERTRLASSLGVWACHGAAFLCDLQPAAKRLRQWEGEGCRKRRGWAAGGPAALGHHWH